MRGHETGNKDSHADCKRAATDPKQLVKVALNSAGPVREISTECFVKLCRRLRLSFGVREMNDDFDWLVAR
jgi:hypothetical protein